MRHQSSSMTSFGWFTSIVLHHNLIPHHLKTLMTLVKWDGKLKIYHNKHSEIRKTKDTCTNTFVTAEAPGKELFFSLIYISWVKRV